MKTATPPTVTFYGEVNPGVWSWAVRSRSGACPEQIEPGVWQVSIDMTTGEAWCECPHSHFRLNRHKPSISGSCWHVKQVAVAARAMLKKPKLSVNRQRREAAGRKRL